MWRCVAQLRRTVAKQLQQQFLLMLQLHFQQVLLVQLLRAGGQLRVWIDIR